MCEAIVAAVTHPYFKLRWATISAKWSHENKKELVKKMLIESVNELSVSLLPSNVESATSGSEEEDYFGFNEKGTACQPSGHMSVDMQILEFLKDKDKNLQSHNKYPLMKSLFIRYNTTILSFAPVERLFFCGWNDPHTQEVLIG